MLYNHNHDDAPLYITYDAAPDSIGVQVIVLLKYCSHNTYISSIPICLMM